MAPQLERTGDEREQLGRQPARGRGAGGARGQVGQDRQEPAVLQAGPSTQTARLLTVLVEFDPNANDLGSGNPADGNPLDTPVEDLSLGVELVVRRVAGNNRWVVIGVTAARADNAP